MPFAHEASARPYAACSGAIGNLVQLALHRFRDAASHFRLKMMRQREAQQPRTDVGRYRANLPLPCRAQFGARHGLECGKLGIEIDGDHSGATAR